MVVSWSPLSAALGVADQQLDFGLVERAVDAGLEERPDLEWKAKLPSQDERAAMEFAKDLAAMANSQGGLILYGVRQRDGDQGGKAVGIGSVSLADSELERLRSLADACVRPRIPGLELIPLPNPETASGSGGDEPEGVLAVWVPPSFESPHAAERRGSNGAWGFPLRRGSKTAWLGEHEIERAYQARFAHRVGEARRQRDLIEDVTDRLDVDATGWIVAVSTSRLPAAAFARAMTKGVVVGVMGEAEEVSLRIAPQDGNEDRWRVLGGLGNDMLNPRVGLRRWISQQRSVHGPDAGASLVHVEVHHDGSCCLAAATEGWHRAGLPDKHVLVPGVIESVALDFVSLAAATLRATSATASAGLRVQLVRGDDRPWATLEYQRTGPMRFGDPEQPFWSRTVRRPLPVQGELSPRAGDDEIRAAAQQIALDVANQFGIQDLTVLP